MNEQNSFENGKSFNKLDIQGIDIFVLIVSRKTNSFQLQDLINKPDQIDPLQEYFQDGYYIADIVKNAEISVSKMIDTVLNLIQGF